MSDENPSRDIPINNKFASYEWAEWQRTQKTRRFYNKSVDRKDEHPPCIISSGIFSHNGYLSRTITQDSNVG